MEHMMLAPNTIVRVVVFCVCLLFCASSGGAEGAPAMIELTSPVGGETWAGGSYHNITWKTNQAPRGTQVSVAYSTDGGRNWITIRDTPADRGRFLWGIPNTISDSCLVRVSPDGISQSVRSASSFSIVRSRGVGGYKWVNVTRNAAFAPRDGAGSLSFKGQMWLLGGWHPGDKVHFPRICNNEVWSSKDGATWNLVKPNTFLDNSFDPTSDWEGRHTGGYVVYNDKMWLVGGDANQGHYQFDVWNSADGTNWNYVNKNRNVPWGPRVLHYTLVFQDKIWVMGGQTMPAFAQAKEKFYRDIWNTTDGVNWKKVIPQEPYWSARGLIGGGVVFKDRMWVLGGGTYDTPQTPTRKFFNDVWSSSDGENWVRHVEHAPWNPRQYHYVTVFDDRMWVLGGYKDGDRNDVWYSADGVNWYKLHATPWGRRHAASVFVHDSALWIAAGSYMAPDVWKLERSSSPDGATESQGVPVVLEQLTDVSLGLEGIDDRTAYIYDNDTPDKSPYPLNIFDGRTVSTPIFTSTFGLCFYGLKGENTNVQLKIDADGDISFDKWLDGGDGLQIVIDNRSNPPSITIRRGND
jgi:hypothetical protein